MLYSICLVVRHQRSSKIAVTLHFALSILQQYCLQKGAGRKFLSRRNALINSNSWLQCLRTEIGFRRSVIHFSSMTLAEVFRACVDNRCWANIFLLRIARNLLIWKPNALSSPMLFLSFRKLMSIVCSLLHHIWQISHTSQRTGLCQLQQSVKLIFSVQKQ